MSICAAEICRRSFHSPHAGTMACACRYGHCTNLLCNERLRPQTPSCTHASYRATLYHPRHVQKLQLQGLDTVSIVQLFVLSELDMPLIKLRTTCSKRNGVWVDCPFPFCAYWVITALKTSWSQRLMPARSYAAQAFWNFNGVWHKSSACVLENFRRNLHACNASLLLITQE